MIRNFSITSHGKQNSMGMAQPLVITSGKENPTDSSISPPLISLTKLSSFIMGIGFASSISCSTSNYYCKFTNSNPFYYFYPKGYLFIDILAIDLEQNILN